MSQQIMHNTVNVQNLPTYQQARKVMCQFYNQHARPTRTSTVYIDFWANSTPTSGVRDIRIRVYIGTQAVVDQVIGQFLAFVAGQLPKGSYKVYSHQWHVRNLSNPRLKHNCAKVYYRSTQR
ncbi:hypothetical protein LCGC14_1395620 [marine sediment metagenome]|uniref:Uncharacterized protein n=1 Tax=marine sediment metagenome TaxID=412755 RepID=A0A0F9ME77_9ZZZZ